jgi:hypothetical protein
MSDERDALTWFNLFVHTGYGDSVDYTGGEADDMEDSVKTQGGCQGNSTAPCDMDGNKHPNDSHPQA